MYHHLDYHQFIEFIYKLCMQKTSGFVFFSTVDDAWGKVKIHQGEILSIGYKSVWGSDSLPLIKDIEQVKCFFQKKTVAEGEEAPIRHPSLPPTSELLGVLQMENLSTVLHEIEALIEKEKDSVELEEQAHAPRTLPGEKRILVADDSKVARSQLVKALETASYRVTEARDGYEAIGLAEDVQPDLMIVDVQMPGIDGYKVLSAVRGNRRLRDTPVFLVTSSGGILPRLKGHMAHCDEFLEKPLDLPRLLKLVRKHIQESALGG